VDYTIVREINTGGGAKDEDGHGHGDDHDRGEGRNSIVREIIHGGRHLALKQVVHYTERPGPRNRSYLIRQHGAEWQLPQLLPEHECLVQVRCAPSDEPVLGRLAAAGITPPAGFRPAPPMCGLLGGRLACAAAVPPAAAMC